MDGILNFDKEFLEFLRERSSKRVTERKINGKIVVQVKTKIIVVHKIDGLAR